MPRAHDDRNAFRCSIAQEYSAAKIRIGRKRFSANVLDTSRDGFTVKLRGPLAQRVPSRGEAELWFRGEHWLIRKRSQYKESEEFCHVGFERIRELTKFKAPPTWWQTLRPRLSTHNGPEFLMCLLVVFGVACTCLPGLGDKMGTAPLVREVLQGFVKSIQNVF